MDEKPQPLIYASIYTMSPPLPTMHHHRATYLYHTHTSTRTTKNMTQNNRIAALLTLLLSVYTTNNIDNCQGEITE